MTNIQLIEKLSNANGISGFEDEVLTIIRTEGASLGSFKEDSLRNLYLSRKNNANDLPTIMLDCHTDEVGFMVKAIRPNGLLEFINIGGWITTNIPAHLVRIRNKDGVYIPGLVASKPPHFMSEAERKAPLEADSLTIDVGASSAEEVRKGYRIGIGAPVVPEATFFFSKEHGTMTGKAFDNRLGCAASLATLKALEDCKLKVNLVAGFASQEEVGTRGASLTAQAVKPKVAIVFEGCPADDTCVPEYQAQTVLKKGPMLRHIDARMITNPRFQRFALNLAEKLGIPCQEAVRSGGATNGSPIHTTSPGVPCIVIGIPVRYAHTHYGISSISDFENSVKLACEVIKSLDQETMDSF